MKLQQWQRWVWLDAVIVVCLGVIFGYWYFSQHAWGAWGDDSPGYIYTAGQLLQAEPLVVQDSIVQQALSTFGSEKLARFVAPTHHEIISPQGWIASRYPLGLSGLMWLAATLAQTDTAIYLVVPLCAVIVIVCTYWFALVVLPVPPAVARACGIIAALAVGLASLFANYTVAQPMREIPALAFFMISILAVMVALRSTTLGRSVVGLGLAGLAYGYSINIRETSAILIIAIACLFFYQEPTQLRRVRRQQFGIFMLAVVLATSLSIWNSAVITVHKEKFRDKDISRIAVTSNFDHIQSLSVKNMYDNQGKFKPGVGGVVQYWTVLTEFSTWPPFLLLAAVGLVGLWLHHRRLAYFFLSWIGTIFVLFSMWINPYPRYILPIFPAVAVLAGYGMWLGLIWVRKKFQPSAWVWAGLSLVVMGSWFVSLRPLVAARQTHVSHQENVYKAISYQDLQTLRHIGQTIPSSTAAERPALLLMLGVWKAGISETLMTHSDIRVIRYPRKTNEQPPFDQLIAFLQQLQQTYDLYLWYDGTAGVDEQRLFNQLTLEPVSTYTFSFQPTVELYAITAIN